MTREQFDQAVGEAYPRLCTVARIYLNESDPVGPLGMVHNVILWLLVKRLTELTYDGQAEFEKFLRLTLIGQIRDRFRTDPTIHERYHFEDVKINIDEVPDDGPTPLEELERLLAEYNMDRDSTKVWMAIKHLPERQRLTVLYVLDGFTQDQIAVCLRLGQPAVSRIYERALGRLRRLLLPYVRRIGSEDDASTSYKTA